MKDCYLIVLKYDNYEMLDCYCITKDFKTAKKEWNKNLKDFKRIGGDDITDLMLLKTELNNKQLKLMEDLKNNGCDNYKYNKEYRNIIENAYCLDEINGSDLL